MKDSNSRDMLRKWMRKITSLFMQPMVAFYLRKDRHYQFHGTPIVVKKNVFHPGFFFSTKFLLRYLNEFKLNQKTLLELGAATGLIAIESAKRGASVTATDISSASVENLSINAALNQVALKILRSDLFDEIPVQHFDFIIVNPPYYKKDPEQEYEFAWYAGSNLQYFSKLFQQIKSYMTASTIAILVASEDCDLPSIQKIAGENGITLELKKQRLFLWEQNYIFQIARSDGNQ